MSLPRLNSLRVHLLGLAAILGVLCWVYWPTLRDGLFADDFVAMAILDGKFAAPRRGLDLFNFADGTAQDVHALRRLGSLPWWAPEDYRISFMRPLSSALWRVDRTLFGDHYGAYHAHSLSIFLLLVVGTSFMYRRMFSPSVALVATCLFAIDDSFRFPVIWLSNRGGIYAFAFGLLALYSHLQVREAGRTRYALLTAAAASISLLFGEWGLPALAYIAAYELVAVEARPIKRMLALLPALVPCVSFIVARAALHYGARGSGAYVDPGAEPARFLLSVLHRVPVFFADMLWSVPSEWWDHDPPWRAQLLSAWFVPPSIWVRLPGWHFVHFTLGLAAFGALALGWRMCRPGLSSAELKNARFLLLGSVGALLPVVGSFPSTRLTIVAFWGLAPMIALMLREFARRLRALRLELSARFVTRFAALAAAVGLVVHLQVFEPLRGSVQGQVDGFATTSQWVFAADLDPARVADQQVFLLAGSEFTSTFFFSYIWANAGKPLPRTYYPLTACPCAHFLQRTAPNELVMRALGGAYLASGDENMFHSPRRSMYEGETVELEGLRIRAEEVVDGTPRSLRLTFARPLEDPSYVFLTAAPFGLVRTPLPAVGQETLLKRAAEPNWIELERHHFLVRFGPVPEMLSYGSFPSFVVYKPL